MSQVNSMFEDDQGNIYCVSNAYGVYKSTDGSSFTRQSEAPFNDALATQTVWFDEGSKRVFGFIAGGGDIHYSDDYGVTWTQGTKVTDEGFPQFMQFAGGSKIWTYMWSTKPANNGFYSSSDATNWTGPAVTTTSFDGRSDQLIKGKDDSQIFLASTKGYVHVSNDTGKTWSLYEDGLDSFDIIDRNEATSKFVPVVRMTASGGKLILATSGSLYMADMDGGSTVSVPRKVALLMNVYPNPSSHRLNIKISAEVQAVSISTLTGEQVYASQGFSGYIDVKNLQSGMYILNIQTDKGNTNAKIFIKH
jgi:hypothetical protein